MPARRTHVQRDVQQLLDRAIADGTENAIQVAAYLHGELVVDAWATPAGRNLDGFTLFPFFSTGKGIAATAIHRLVERGVLSWDAPIATYWPEFAAQGKGGILLRHVLNHTAGLPMMPENGDISRAADWDGMCRYLAGAAPLHAPGARRHYHAITYSWLVGETAQRADGRTFGRIITEEVCRPLGIDGLFFGVPDAARSRCIDAEAAPPPATPPPPPATPAPPADPVSARAIPSWVWPLEDWINSDAIRGACICASNGFGSARSIARHYAALIGAGVAGVRLLAPETLSAATHWNAAVDGAIPGAGRWGLGYGLQGPDDAPGAVFGHGGYGGSTGFADTRHGLAVAVVRSRMGGTSVVGPVVEAIRRCAEG